VLRDAGRLAEAEAQYRLALAEQPDFLVAWICLGDIMITQRRWGEADQLAQQMESRPNGRVNALLLRARSSMFRKDYVIARQLAEQAIALSPGAVWPLEVMSHVLVLEARDWTAAERTLRDVLALQPNNSTALANLAVAQKALGRRCVHRPFNRGCHTQQWPLQVQRQVTMVQGCALAWWN
jgi:tetratricopeptide (TPR) repeat protein